MNRLDEFNGIIREIENRLTGEIDVAALARIANLSTYEFRRIFAYLTGTPIGEYVRKRRLTLAAEELLSGQNSVTEIALKYGYDAPSSFSRAFKEFHGVTPQAVLSGESKINVFTKFGFELKATGGGQLSCEIKKEDGFYIVGKKAVSAFSDTECCEDAWNSFYASPDLDGVLKMANGRIYAAYLNGENSVDCYIGARTATEIAAAAEDKNGFARLYVPPCLWARFTLRGVADETVNRFYQDTLFHWLSSSNYERDNAFPNVEVYPEDMEEDGFLWEAWIPVKRKGEV